MKKIIFTLALIAIPMPSLFALSSNIEVTCSPELVSKYSCNQCFDAGYLYENQSMPLADSVRNIGTLEADYYQNELALPIVGNIGAWIVTFNNPSFKISSTFTTNGLYDNGKGEFYTFLNPGDSFRWIETLPGYDIWFSSINKALVNDSNRASIRDKNFTIVYTLHPRYWDNTLGKYTPATSQTHIECQSIGAHFCGDGFVEPSKEVCDEGGLNGQPGHCNTSCTAIPPVATPACSSIVASPAFGNSPVTTSLTCSGMDLPAGSTYAIACGNGTNAVMTGNVGTCTYTNPSSTSSATFAPKCTINGALTSPACQTNVGVNPGILAACIPGTTTGPQIAPLIATSPNLCPATQVVGGFTGATVATTTTYNWSCNGSAVGGACAASYNSALNVPILSIKKYANTADGQVVGDALSLVAGSSFNYRYDVTNSGNVAATGVVVTDTLPQYTTLGAVTAPTGWTCATGSKTVATITYPTVICTTASLAPNTTVSITVWTTLAAVIPVSTELRNIVYTCKFGDAPNTNCTPGCTDPNNPACTPVPPPPNCNPIASNPNYDPACVIIVNAAFDLSIKKFVNWSDAQAAVNAVDVASNTGFTYTLVVKNEWPVTSTGTTTVTDTLPAGVTLVSVPNIAPWTCTANLPGNSFNCTTSNQIASGAVFPTITVNASTTSNTGIINNIGTVANVNDTNPLNNTDPAVIRAGITAVNGFDLSLKKYIGTNDAQTALSTTNGAILNYILRVTNSGTTASSGTTTVQDILPVGVEYDTVTASGSGWTCTVTTRTLRCTSTQTIAIWASYPDITVPFRVTATAGQAVTNIAAVDNPNEINRCNVSGLLPATDTAICTRDITNSDIAVLSIPGTPPGWPSTYYVPTCTNGIRACSQQNYNSLPWCQTTTWQTCYNELVDCNAGNTLTCPWPGGPTCTNPSWCVPYSNGSCGDGVLQPSGTDWIGWTSDDEECDVQWLNGTIGSFCSANCKITILTNPGANPITDLWMTIPVLAGTQRLGYTWLDGERGKVAFNDNRMVLWVGTKAFTLADKVGFGIRTQYKYPLILEADKKACLQSTGNSLNSEIICTSFGEAANADSRIEKWQRVDGKYFVNIGIGDYQILNPTPRPPAPTLGETNYTAKLQAYYDWRQYLPASSHSANNITLFRGPVQYQMPNGNAGPTLNSAFFARNIGTDGTISLLGCSLSDCSATAVVNLVSLPVRVSSAVVSTVGSASNRSLETFLNPGTLFAGFLWSTQGYTSTTNSNNNSTTNNIVPLPVITATIANPTITTVTELESYAVNGNKNVLAINGNLTIQCPVGRSIFEMNGVRTVIVTGNLIIKCNLIYASNDTESSWAWITKGGNILIYNGVGTLSDGAITNIAGVFVSVKEGTNGGDITYTGNATTQTILRVEGTLYGNASPLFNSRLYARATGAYDILTTGTILNYSNRALTSPPPLLSQYLRNYQVQRVVQ